MNAKIIEPAIAVPIVNPTIQSISVARDRSIWAVDQQGRVLRCTENLQPWTAATPDATLSALAVSDAAGCVFGIIDGAVFVRSPQPGAPWAPLPTPPAALVTLAAGDGDAASFQLWATDKAGKLWSYSATSTAWRDAGVQAHQITATSDGAVYRLSNGQVFARGQSTWSSMAVPETVTSVAAGAESYLWIVGKSGSVYQYDPVDGDGWNQVSQPPAAGGTLSVGNDSNVWLVAGGALYQYDAQNDGWGAPLPWSGRAALASVSLANLAQAWALDANGDVYQYTEFVEQWDAIAGSGLPALRQVSAADRATLWGTDGSGGVYLLTSSASGWQSTSVSGPTLVRVSASSDDTLWGIDAQGAAYSFSDGGFVRQSTVPALGTITVGGPDQIAGLDSDGGVYKWDAGARAWQPFAASGAPFIDLSINSDGLMWAIDRGNVLHIYLDQWVATGAGQLTQVSISSEGEVWGVSTRQTPVHISQAGSHLEALATNTGGMPRWDGVNAFDETQSTHLWIVNRAIALARGQGVDGQRLYMLAKPFEKKIGDLFHDALCQGLYDADFRAPYNNPIRGFATYSSHFYDPDTGKNWLGRTSPTALTEGRKFFQQSVEAFQSGDLQAAGYDLGLALHYLTDLTQPMHAANFTYLDSSPRLGYHSAYERYVMEIQGSVHPPGVYVPSDLGTDPDGYLVTAARRAKSQYKSKICPLVVYIAYYKYTNYYRLIAWAWVQPILSDAISITSQFLIAWAQSAAPSGNPWYTIRFNDGTWTPKWCDVDAQMKNTPGPFGAIACAGTDQGMQLVALDANGEPWHTIRIGNGTWSTQWNLIPNPPHPFLSVACTGLDHGMQLVALDGGGTPWHTIRFRDGTWQDGWGNVAAMMSNHPGPFKAVGCAGTVAGTELVALDQDGVPWHTIRRHDGTWQAQWDNIAAIMSNQPGPFRSVACAGTDQGLQLVVLDASGAVWHAIRAADGKWSPAWTDVDAQVGAAPGPFTAIANAATGDGSSRSAMQLVALDANGSPWHTIRLGNGKWQAPWGNVDGAMSNTPGPYQSVACAAGPLLQLVGLTGRRPSNARAVNP